MSAQFFSSLADNALFVAAIELLQHLRRAGLAARRRWCRCSRCSTCVLAPFVGAFADAVPKGKVMFVSNTIKVVGCLMMLFGTPPAAVLRHRRPRRGGLLAGQVRHPHRAAAAVAAGQGQRLDRGPDHRLDHPRRAARRPAGRAARCRRRCSGFDLPLIDTGIDTPPEGGDLRRSSSSTWSAALFNLYIPRTEAPLQPLRAQPGGAGARLLAAATRGCGATSWARSRWPRRRCSGASRGNLRYIVLAWAAAALGYSTTQASSLVGVVAIGTAVGAVAGLDAHAAGPGHRR